MEQTKTAILKLQKQKTDLIREKDVIDTFRLTETGEKNRLIKEQISRIEKQKRLIREKDVIDTFRLKETFEKKSITNRIKKKR
jgi:sulfur relay (sulfurtransferase) DsrF/TusC family protein